MTKKISNNIVLLHGWGASSAKLNDLANELTLRKYNVFTPELPGFDIDASKDVWDLGYYADYAIKKSNNFFNGNDYLVFGHSFGGRIAIKMAIKSERVSGIILCATGGISRASLLKRMVFAGLAKAGKALLVFKPIAKYWRKVLYKAVREHDYEKTTGVMRQTFKNVVSEDLKPIVGKIKLPTLILWGDEDKMTPVADAYYIKSKVKGSKLITFGGVGHKLPYEKPKEIAEEISLWQTNQQ